MTSALLLTMMFFGASVDSMDSRLAVLQSELRTAPDSTKILIYLAMAELRFFNSFKFSSDEKDVRRAELDQALQMAEIALKLNRTSTARTMTCAILLERARLLDNKSAILTLDTCQKELAEILKQDPSSDFTRLVLGALGVELARINGTLRSFAGLIYAPIPNEPSLDVSLLCLLQAKHARLYPVFTYLKLGEAYITLRNAKDAVESLKACLREPERYPYFDAHCKRIAKERLDDYLPRIR